MAEDFTTVFERADYRVRLSRGGWAIIRIGAPLPAALRKQVGEKPWGLITAWNPQGKLRDRQANRIAQRQLLQALQTSSSITGILPAAGVGPGWCEPGFFIIGIKLAMLDTLARCHQQLACVHGADDGAAQLHWTTR